MDRKRVLVIGGTGVMGTYLVPTLADKGYLVDVVSLEECVSESENIRYFCADCHDSDYLRGLLKNNYDGIVDFLHYGTEQFKKRYKLLLDNTKHLIFLSSYRVYAGVDAVTTENSPRLTEVIDDKELLASDDYAIAKCRCEDILRASKYGNYTIIRPSIIYSHKRCQLLCCEASTILRRTYENKPVVLPREGMNVQATMTWAGDMAKIIVRLLFNEKAYGETFTTATSEHNPWSYVAQCYHEILGLEVALCSKEEYLNFYDGDFRKVMKWQLEYDRLYNRVLDNSKLLDATGLKSEDFMPLADGLKCEIPMMAKDFDMTSGEEINRRMDEYLKKRG